MQKRGIGANVGSLLDGVMVDNGVTPSKALRLVGFKVGKVPPNKMTIPACKKARGYILIGPPKGFELDITRVRAFDWTLHPIGTDLQAAPAVATTRIKKALRTVEDITKDAPEDRQDEDVAVEPQEDIATQQLEAGREMAAAEEAPRHEKPVNGITYTPAMVLSQRMHVECEDPKCFKGALWVDDIRRRSKKLLGEQLRKAEGADASVREGVIKTFSGKLPCTKCGKLLTPMYHMHRKLVAEGPKDNRAEALFGSYDDQALAPFYAAAESDDRLYLPRVWAVYRADRTPADMPAWSPQDPAAVKLEKRVNQDGNTIRPYGLAQKAANFKGSLVTFLLDVPPNGGLVAGWIPEDVLQENMDLGYKVRLILPRYREYSV